MAAKLTVLCPACSRARLADSLKPSLPSPFVPTVAALGRQHQRPALLGLARLTNQHPFLLALHTALSHNLLLFLILPHPPLSSLLLHLPHTLDTISPRGKEAPPDKDN